MNTRILIIDDTRSIHDDFQKILAGNADRDSLDALEAELFGDGPTVMVNRPHYVLDSAYGGQDGHAMVSRALAEGRPYAMAFVDMRMPAGWDGLETIQHLWQEDPELQVVICTAYSDHSWEDLMRELGPSDNLLILKKPFDEIEICQLVYTLTTKRHLTDQARQHTRDVEKLVEVRTEELERSRHELENTNLRLQSILDTVPVGLVTLLPDGRIDSANKAAADSFGYLPEEMEGIPLKTLVSQHEPGLGQIEATGRKKDGTDFPVAVSLRDVPLHSDHIFTGVISDITDRKRAMDELLTAKTKAEQADKAKSEFLARMSHELRTPMTGVLGMAHKLLDGGLGPEQKDSVQLIVVSAESLLDTINEILDLAKVESGQMSIECIPFDLHRIIDEVVGLLGPTAVKRSLRLEVNYDPSLPRWFAGDPVRVRQILNNLVGNALKFTSRGSVTVTVASEGEGLRVEVRDTGLGIPADKHDLIFQKFAQADVSTTRQFGGTGLGLPICRELVALMGGELGLSSEMGHGSTFWFSLPLRPTAPPSTPAGREEEAQLEGARILLAEDNPVNQQMATHFLNRWGCEVDVATTGEEAVRLFETNHYQLILMDCQMPVLDGFDAARAIRSQGSNVPMIAFTASTLGDDIKRCQEAGMDDVLSKPITPAKLRASLSRWLVAGAA